MVFTNIIQILITIRQRSRQRLHKYLSGNIGLCGKNYLKLLCRMLKHPFNQVNSLTNCIRLAK
jgi:hypothetical protein